MPEYRLDVRPFIDDVGGGVQVDDTIQIDELVVGDERFVMRGPVSFSVSVSNAGEMLVAIGSVTAPVVANCSRCLCDFDTQIVGDVEGFWERPGQEVPEDVDLSGEVDMEGRIDLAPALIAALVVEAPFAPLHDEECAGLCATCGADLNVEECGCQQPSEGGSPFEALKGLFVEEDAEKEAENPSGE